MDGVAGIGALSRAAGGTAAAPVQRDEVQRPRLVEQLARRWVLPLVTIEAAAGYGKSTLLAQAVRDNLADPSGFDYYLPCTEAHRDPAVLLRSILGLFTDEFEGSVSVDDQLVAVLDQLQLRSPRC